jgi:hypothetical protein
VPQAMPRIQLERIAVWWACRWGSANPRQPGSSASPVKTIMNTRNGTAAAQETAGVNGPTVAPPVTNAAATLAAASASGSAMTTAYQRGWTRHRVMRPARSRSPAGPCAVRVTTTADTSGPNCPSAYRAKAVPTPVAASPDSRSAMWWKLSSLDSATPARSAATMPAIHSGQVIA